MDTEHSEGNTLFLIIAANLEAFVMGFGMGNVQDAVKLLTQILNLGITLVSFWVLKDRIFPKKDRTLPIAPEKKRNTRKTNTNKVKTVKNV